MFWWVPLVIREAGELTQVGSTYQVKGKALLVNDCLSETETVWRIYKEAGSPGIYLWVKHPGRCSVVVEVVWRVLFLVKVLALDAFTSL